MSRIETRGFLSYNRKMKKNLTDEEILKTADALNWEKGFDKMRIIDIARALRVSHTAI